MGDEPKDLQTPRRKYSYDHAQETLTGHVGQSSRSAARSKGAPGHASLGDAIANLSPTFLSQDPIHPTERLPRAQTFAYHSSIDHVPPSTFVPCFAPFQSSALHVAQMTGALPNYQGQPHQASAAYRQQSTNHTYMSQQGNYPPEYPQGQYLGGYSTFGPSRPFSSPHPAQMYAPAQLYLNQNNRIYQKAHYVDQRFPVQMMHYQGEYRTSQLPRPMIHPAGTTKQMACSPNRAQDFTFDRSLSSGDSSIDGSRRKYTAPSEISRGPPRRPRQSGHALWVGNLPPDATITDLKDHFSREATKDIESLKLISKTNCAFVNYRTQAACAAAMTRFHESRFHGTRLVCRVRRKSAPSPATSVTPGGVSSAQPSHGEVDDKEKERAPVAVKSEDLARNTVLEKFFILKSLTLQDLEISTRNGVWATQMHNERTLNEAFKSAENVYLIFSANKSGEYFGHARMCSVITAASSDSDLSISKQTSSSTDSTTATTPTPASGSGHSNSASDAGPKISPTPPTEWAPRGRIIDDLARGTMFWEAAIEGEQSINLDGTGSIDPDINSAILDDQQVIASSTDSSTRQLSFSETLVTEEESDQLQGNSFRLEWLSTRKVPFFKTRGMRNPWNANKEVKIARDGTEIETTVGKKLLNLFSPPNLRPLS